MQVVDMSVTFLFYRFYCYSFSLFQILRAIPEENIDKLTLFPPLISKNNLSIIFDLVKHLSPS